MASHDVFEHRLDDTKIEDKDQLVNLIFMLRFVEESNMCPVHIDCYREPREINPLCTCIFFGIISKLTLSKRIHTSHRIFIDGQMIMIILMMVFFKTVKVVRVAIFSVHMKLMALYSYSIALFGRFIVQMNETD